MNTIDGLEVSEFSRNHIVGRAGVGRGSPMFASEPSLPIKDPGSMSRMSRERVVACSKQPALVVVAAGPWTLPDFWEPLPIGVNGSQFRVSKLAVALSGPVFEVRSLVCSGARGEIAHFMFFYDIDGLRMQGVGLPHPSFKLVLVLSQ